MFDEARVFIIPIRELLFIYVYELFEILREIADVSHAVLLWLVHSYNCPELTLIRELMRSPGNAIIRPAKYAYICIIVTNFSGYSSNCCI